MNRSDAANPIGRIRVGQITFSIAMHYAQSVGKWELGLAAGVDYVLSRNGTMDDLHTRVDLRPFHGADFSLSIGLGLRLEW